MLFSKNIRNIFGCYCWVLLAPFNFQNGNTLMSTANTKNSTWKFRLHAFTLVYGLCFVIHNILLVAGVYYEAFGDLDVFGQLESALWILAYCTLIPTEAIVHRKEYSLALERSLQQMDSIWLQYQQKTCTRILSQLRNQVWTIFLHNNVMDFFNIFSFVLTIYGAMSYRIYIYSVFPWKNIGCELTAFVLQSLSSFSFALSWGFMLSFPGIHAYHSSATIKCLSISYHEKMQIENILWQYKLLGFSQRRVNDNMKIGLLAMYLLIGLQQTAECYILFQLIKAGDFGSYTAYMVFDIMTIIGQVAHSFYAISSVDSADRRFRRETGKCIFSMRHSRNQRLMTSKVFNSIPRVLVEMGSIRCEKDVVLDGMMQFLDYYATAALWP